MTNEIKTFIEKFKVISKKGWIKNENKSWGSVGLTFEKQLGKKADSMFFPDYYDIEIKCTTLNSKYPLFLFTLSLDGPTFPEINRLVKNFGHYDKDYPDKKVLFETINDDNSRHKFRFKFDINREEEKIYLCVYDIHQNLIEKESFVYFDSIKNHLLAKLNNLAVIFAAQKTLNKEKFFHYYKLQIYKLKNFEIFLNLLEKNIIKVDLIARISKSGTDVGRYRNKNLVFKIDKDNIWRLFDRIYSYSSKI